MDLPPFLKYATLPLIAVGSSALLGGGHFEWKPPPCEPVVRELNYVGDFECSHPDHTMRLLVAAGRYEDAVAVCDCPAKKVQVEWPDDK